MFKVVDIKPGSGLVEDRKPTMGGVVSILPRLSKVYGEVIRWRSAGRGFPIGPGFFMFLTYPTDEKL